MAGRLCCSLRIHVLRELNRTAGEETFDRRLFLFCSGHAILMFINLFRRMREYMRFLPAAFLSSLLFGLMHGNMVQFIYATLIGLLLAFIYEHYGNLRAVVLFHAIGNLTSGLSALFLTPQILHELPALPWIAAGAFLLAAGTGLLAIEKYVRPPVYRRPVFPAAEEEDKEADQKEI